MSADDELTSGPTHLLPAGLEARLLELVPGARIVSARALGDDDAGRSASEAHKQLGYGRPIRVELESPRGSRTLVVHTARANDFGHDRRADRADAMLLAYDTFKLVPGHVPAVDVGAIRHDGTLLPLGDTGELYLVTEWAEGGLYADDLRRVAETGVASELDLSRAEALATHLAQMHRIKGSHDGAYVRAIRDLVGHGEGIAGIVDAYPDDTPFAGRDRLEAIERSTLAWRHALKRRTARLRRTHGDFHPFNIVFPAGSASPVLLDTSRGSEGDPADDVAALTINYLFFGLRHRDRWEYGLGLLWQRFFETYVAQAELGVLDTIAPFYAWRGLVIACPLWYPATHAEDRDRILSFVERALAAPRFDLGWGPEAMR